MSGVSQLLFRPTGTEEVVGAAKEDEGDDLLVSNPNHASSAWRPGQPSSDEESEEESEEAEEEADDQSIAADTMASPSI